MEERDELGHFLARARAEYRDTLPAKLEEIDRLLSLLESETPTSGEREQLFEIIHRISGTAGSFGMDDLGRVADEWEHLLRDLRGGLAGTADCAKMRILLEKLRTALKAEFPPD